MGLWSGSGGIRYGFDEICHLSQAEIQQRANELRLALVQHQKDTLKYCEDIRLWHPDERTYIHLHRETDIANDIRRCKWCANYYRVRPMDDEEAAACAETEGWDKLPDCDLCLACVPLRQLRLKWKMYNEMISDKNV